MTSYDQKRYVDYIETVCETGQQAQQSLGPLQAFCDALDLQVDPKKTYCRTDRAQRVERSRYSNPESGKRLRNMTYSKWSTKGTILEKIEKLAPFWRRLSRSAAPKFQKLPCSKVSAWPNTFHSIGISSVHFEKFAQKLCRQWGLIHMGPTQYCSFRAFAQVLVTQNSGVHMRRSLVGENLPPQKWLIL